MCQIHTGEPHDCMHCHRTITLDGFATVGAEYDELERQGWIVIPTTGTQTYCSIECRAGGYRTNPKYWS